MTGVRKFRLLIIVALLYVAYRLDVFIWVLMVGQLACIPWLIRDQRRVEAKALAELHELCDELGFVVERSYVWLGILTMKPLYACAHVEGGAKVERRWSS